MQFLTLSFIEVVVELTNSICLTILPGKTLVFGSILCAFSL